MKSFFAVNESREKRLLTTDLQTIDQLLVKVNVSCVRDGVSKGGGGSELSLTVGSMGSVSV